MTPDEQYITEVQGIDLAYAMALDKEFGKWQDALKEAKERMWRRSLQEALRNAPKITLVDPSGQRVDETIQPYAEEAYMRYQRALFRSYDV